MLRFTLQATRRAADDDGPTSRFVCLKRKKKKIFFWIYTKRWRNVCRWYLNNQQIARYRRDFNVLRFTAIFAFLPARIIAAINPLMSCSPPPVSSRTEINATAQRCNMIPWWSIWLNTHCRTHCWWCRTSLGRSQRNCFASPSARCPSPTRKSSSGCLHKRRYYNYYYYHCKRLVQSKDWTSELLLLRINIGSTVAL